MQTGWLFLIFVFIFSSCKKENRCDCLKSTGSETTEIRNLSGFKKINLSNNVDLVITPGRPFACKVMAGSNLLDLVTTEVDGETLIIKNKNKCNWVRSFKNRFLVEISMPHLEYIYYSGSGSISTTDTIREPVFSLDGWTCSGSVNLLLDCGTTWLSLHTGTADLKASGSSGVSYVYSAAMGPVDVKNLFTGFTYIANRGTNECFVNVSKELGATITLQGNIYYTGNPYHIEQEISGTGHLIKL